MNPQPPSPPSLQNVDIESIVRSVLQRLVTSQPEEKHNNIRIADRVVTLASLNDVPNAADTITLVPGAIITPAARDELRQRGIALDSQPSGSVPVQALPPQTTATPSPIRLMFDQGFEDATQTAITKQLSVRSVSLCDAATVSAIVCLRPAAMVCEQVQHGRRAAMISHLADVRRFAQEITPQAYVIDWTRFNLMSAVNAITEISRLVNHSSPVPGGQS